eukprot:gb/GECH01012475.1/.p1 GENE.gb/GECH01012475.1/~~gb/GECH01012475.1/.p1  ORF type:complete len:264 (+),score=20.11 gb/GECH01012475.1/:1-792(+)
MAEIPGVQATWDYLTDTYSESMLSSVGTFIVHESIYFGIYGFYFLADFIPSLRKYKIQEDKENTGPLQWKCLRVLLFNHLVIQMPMILFALESFIRITGMTVTGPLPSAGSLVAQMMLYLVVEDFYFYWIHRLLHHGAWYKHVHKMHHEYAAPFGMAAEYAHPIETMFLGIGTILGPLLTCQHLFTLWLWLLVRLAETIEVHCGYDFPWSPNRFLPFYGGARFHDWHHERNVGNFASTFTVWDWAFGTDKHYRRYYNKLNHQD